MYRPRVNRIATILALFICTVTALAEHPPGLPVSVEIGSTMVGAATNAGEHESAGIAAFDVAASVPVPYGQITLLIEAESRPGFMSGYADYRPMHNNGRVAFGASHNEVAFAELHYDFVTAGGEWSIGYLDSRAYIDGSSIANDDKTQFSNQAFVNNPTIGLPANSPGFSWRRPARAGQPGYSFLFAATGGPGRFIAFESSWTSALATTRLGAWDKRTEGLIPEGRMGSNHEFGFYTSIDGSLGQVNWNVRAGIARLKHRFSDTFTSIAAEVPVDRNMVGIAVGRGIQGDTMPVVGSRKINHVEMYYRHVISAGIVITPCIQFSQRNDGAGALMAGVRFRLSI